MALPPDDKNKPADKPADAPVTGRTTPPPLDKSPAYSEARKAAIAQAAERQKQGGNPADSDASAAAAKPADKDPVDTRVNLATKAAGTGSVPRGEYPEIRDSVRPAGTTGVAGTTTAASDASSNIGSKTAAAGAATGQSVRNLADDARNAGKPPATPDPAQGTVKKPDAAAIPESAKPETPAKPTTTAKPVTGARPADTADATRTTRVRTRETESDRRPPRDRDMRAAPPRRARPPEGADYPARGYRRDGGRPPEGRPVRGRAAPRRKMGPPPGSSRKGYIVRRNQPVRPHTVNPATPHDGSPWGPLLIGLLLLAGVAWYAVRHYTPQIEDDLARRSNEALQGEGINNASVAIDGRTAVLTGSVDSNEQRDLAESTVAGTFGVRAVDNQLTIDRGDVAETVARSEPSFSVTTSGDSVEIAGIVSDAEYATAMEDAANAHFGEDRVNASIAVEEGVTNPGWMSAVNQLIPELDKLDDGGISVADGKLTLTGASDAETKAQIGELATQLTSGQLQVENLIDAPEPVEPEPVAEPEPEVVATKQAFAAIRQTERGLTVSGLMSAEGADALISAIGDAQPVVNTIRVDNSAETPDWTSQLGASVAALSDSEIDGGVLTMARSGTVRLRGAVASEEAKAAAESAVSNVYGDTYPVSNELEVVAAAADAAAEETTSAEAPKLPAFAAVRQSDNGLSVSGFMSGEGAAALVEAIGDAQPLANNIRIDDRAETPDWTAQMGDTVAALADANIDGAVLTMARSGTVRLRGVVESEEAKAAAETAISSAYGDTYPISNELEVVVPPPVPTLAPFASISAADDTVTITGLLPPASAKKISSDYRAAGKSVIENVTRDERVIEPEWADAFAQVIDNLADVDGQRVTVNSQGDVIVAGTVEDDQTKQAVAGKISALFGDSVSLRNDIQVTPTIVPADELANLFNSIDLSGIRFASNSAELSDSSLSILDQIVDALISIPEVDVEISGHTDSAGSYDYNLSLSAQRADVVRDYLVAQGVDGDRLQSTGFGPSRPVASNDTRAGRALNRRIEFKISGE